VTKMKRLLSAATILAALSSNAQAKDIRSFECEVTRVTPPERNDTNPVVNTVLTNVYVGNRLTGFVVEHELADGTVVMRHQQYRNQRLGQGNYMVAWTGQNARDPGLSMTGTFRETRDGSLVYVEQLSRRGRVETTIVHTCERTA
jgi:hypothetical protein